MAIRLPLVADLNMSGRRIFGQDHTWRGFPASGFVYQVQDIVLHGSSFYRLTRVLNPSNPDERGLPPNSPDASWNNDSNPWQLVGGGGGGGITDFVAPQWVAANAYENGAIVRYKANDRPWRLYMNLSGSEIAANSPAPDLNDAWTFQEYDVINTNPVQYHAVPADPTANPPTPEIPQRTANFGALRLRQIVDPIDNVPTWDPQSAFTMGTLVTFDDAGTTRIYEALQDVPAGTTTTPNANPATDTTNWRVAPNGTDDVLSLELDTNNLPLASLADIRGTYGNDADLPDRSTLIWHRAPTTGRTEAQSKYGGEWVPTPFTDMVGNTIYQEDFATFRPRIFPTTGEASVSAGDIWVDDDDGSTFLVAEADIPGDPNANPPVPATTALQLVQLSGHEFAGGADFNFGTFTTPTELDLDFGVESSTSYEINTTAYCLNLGHY